jgi:hypothetical protein
MPGPHEVDLEIVVFVPHMLQPRQPCVLGDVLVQRFQYLGKLLEVGHCVASCVHGCGPIDCGQTASPSST